MIDPAVAKALSYPLLAVAFLATAFSLFLLATSWQSIPSSVPAHFGITGRPDRWTGPWMLFLYPALQSGACVMIWLKRDEELILLWTFALIPALLAYILWESIRIARKNSERLHPLAVYGLLALIAVPAAARGVLTGE
jgi:hypothetical protein